ncbi:MAG: protecting protein DprA [Cyanobacteria bacterium RYN_339]|nr:protecting protein DprA [Cyanobacteria bacterium RYN_339]
MMTDDELKYWVAWSRPGEMRGAQLLALQRAFGSLEAAWRAPAASLSGLVPRRYIAARASCDPQRTWEAVQRPGQRILAFPDPDFPAPLRDIDDPPALLYVRGELPTWERAIAVIGARAASPYGLRMAKRLGRDLAAVGALVVSGAAYGIDTAAHWGALEAGSTVAVLGCGLDQVYPHSNARLYAEIAARGALITEQAPDERASKRSFPRRNRLIVGLSQGVVVVEASLKSGTSATVHLAQNRGLDVFAVPGPADSPLSEGTHNMLRDGARLTTSLEDILDELQWELQASPDPLAISPEASGVLGLLASGPCPVDALMANGGLDAGHLAATLLQLELAGLVAKLPGQRYELV